MPPTDLTVVLHGGLFGRKSDIFSNNKFFLNDNNLLKYYNLPHTYFNNFTRKLSKEKKKIGLEKYFPPSFKEWILICSDLLEKNKRELD
jgi:hypothetical protein